MSNTFMAGPKNQAQRRANQLESLRKKVINPNKPPELSNDEIDEIQNIQEAEDFKDEYEAYKGTLEGDIPYLEVEEIN